MKNRNLIKVGFLSALLCASAVMSGCGKGDDPAPNNGGQQNSGGQTNPDDNKGDEPVGPSKPTDPVKVSALTCTVAEFAEKYTTLKQGEPVTVTLTDVSDANIAKVSEILRKMQAAATISKAGTDAQYFITLILESVSEALKTIPADAFKGVEVLREVVIPACVEVIKSDAFAECVNLTVVKILGEETKVDEKAFEDCKEDIKIEQVGEDGKVSLSFDGNGHKQGSEPEVTIYKGSTTLPDAGSMVRPGFNFLGWAKSADAKKADYEAGAAFNGGADVLYAVWKSYQFVITYHNEDGSLWYEYLCAGPMLESSDEGCVFLTQPYSSYTKVFKGWKDGEGNMYQPGAPISIFRDCDLYMVWEEVENEFEIDKVPVIYY